MIDYIIAAVKAVAFFTFGWWMGSKYGVKIVSISVAKQLCKMGYSKQAVLQFFDDIKKAL